MNICCLRSISTGELGALHSHGQWHRDLRPTIRASRGRGPPAQSPFRFDAAILSRMRSEVTSRSNWAKDKSTLRVSRPIEVVVLNCWVTETNETPCESKSSTSLAKSASDLVKRSTL